MLLNDRTSLLRDAQLRLHLHHDLCSLYKCMFWMGLPKSASLSTDTVPEIIGVHRAHLSQCRCRSSRILLPLMHASMRIDSFDLLQAQTAESSVSLGATSMGVSVRVPRYDYTSKYHFKALQWCFHNSRECRLMQWQLSVCEAFCSGHDQCVHHEQVCAVCPLAVLRLASVPHLCYNPCRNIHEPLSALEALWQWSPRTSLVPYCDSRNTPAKATLTLLQYPCC